jgi:hypothetical protein
MMCNGTEIGFLKETRFLDLLFIQSVFVNQDEALNRPLNPPFWGTLKPTWLGSPPEWGI